MDDRFPAELVARTALALGDFIRQVVRQEVRAALAEHQPAARNSALMTIPEAAEWAKVSTATIRRAVRRGELASRKAGRAHRIVPQDLDTWLSRAVPSTTATIPELAAQLAAGRSIAARSHVSAGTRHQD
jgi:excisionase family DNA binding protein